MKPFFCYYGGKYRTAASLYPAPTYDVVCEPFAGSAGYAVRHNAHKAVLVDLDQHIVGVWQYLINVSAAEVLNLPDVGPEQSLADFAYLPQEARWLIGFWLNKGVAAPVNKPSSWMKSNVRPNSYWGRVIRERIASQVDLIRGWRAVHGSYADLDVGHPATWFVDPPYVGAGKHYRCGSAGIDFENLGAWCRKLPGQTIVCENEGADWLPFTPLASTKACRPGTKSSEVVWISVDNQTDVE